MTIVQAQALRPSHLLAAIASAALVACGGGGSGTEEPAAPLALEASAATSAAAEAAVSVAPATPAVVAAELSEEQRLALAMANSSISTDTAVPEPSPSQAQTVDEVTDKSALAGSRSAPVRAGWDSGVAVQAPTAPVPLSTGRVFYVDSQSGNDSHSGTAGSASGAGMGPWRTMARLAAEPLLPGDTVRLACGSVWNETLRLSASGTPELPIVVTSASASCVARPTIDGSVELPASAWRLHSGNVYKAALSSPPLQVFAGSGYMVPAHHPNKGHDAGNPESVYAAAAANSNRIVANGREGSSNLVIGADLKLPAGASLAAGTRLRIRSNAYIIDESAIASVSGSTLSLTTPTTYPVSTGWGYYLLGQLWMLDSAGEWHHDEASGTLYAWMPDSRAPTSGVRATQLAAGVDLKGRANIVLDGLAVRQAGIGINARNSSGVVVRNTTVSDSAAAGIDASASTGTTVTGNTVTRSGGNGITGVDYTVGWASGMQITNNTVTDSGVAMDGEKVLSLPVRSYAAVRPGHSSLTSGNAITNAGYIGVWPGLNSEVSSNTISGSCTLLDDCAGIYTSGAGANTRIVGNMVQRSRGYTIGKPKATAYTQAQGIYLDESASGVLVSGNTVVDTDNGIHVHVSTNNVIKDNKLYGNRVNQMWFQENRNIVQATGDLFSNTVTGNQIVPVATTSRGILLDTLYADTHRFGSFDANRYFDRLLPNVVDERVGNTRTVFNLAQWKGATRPDGSSRANEVTGWGSSETNFASTVITGKNLVPNGDLATSLQGWSAWNQTSPKGRLVREGCAPGACATYTAGASAGIVSSPNFSVVANTWYRLTVDLATSSPGQLVDLVVRRGGGGSNSYETLSDRGTRFTASGPFARYSVVFKATKSVTAADPVTRDLGARIDIQNIQPGQAVRVANMELVPIAAADASTRSDLLTNPGAVPIQAACPVAATLPALCNSYVRLDDNAPVSWPVYLPARSSQIVYTRDASLVDSDKDGIADAQDACPGTTIGKGVNSRGCPLL